MKKNTEPPFCFKMKQPPLPVALDCCHEFELGREPDHAPIPSFERMSAGKIKSCDT
jgi:hypothetical protein